VARDFVLLQVIKTYCIEHQKRCPAKFRCSRKPVRMPGRCGSGIIASITCPDGIRHFGKNAGVSRRNSTAEEAAKFQKESAALHLLLVTGHLMMLPGKDTSSDQMLACYWQLRPPVLPHRTRAGTTGHKIRCESTGFSSHSPAPHCASLADSIPWRQASTAERTIMRRSAGPPAAVMPPMKVMNTRTFRAGTGTFDSKEEVFLVIHSRNRQ